MYTPNRGPSETLTVSWWVGFLSTITTSNHFNSLHFFLADPAPFVIHRALFELHVMDLPLNNTIHTTISQPDSSPSFRLYNICPLENINTNSLKLIISFLQQQPLKTLNNFSFLLNPIVSSSDQDAREDF